MALKYENKLTYPTLKFLKNKTVSSDNEFYVGDQEDYKDIQRNAVVLSDDQDHWVVLHVINYADNKPCLAVQVSDPEKNPQGIPFEYADEYEERFNQIDLTASDWRKKIYWEMTNVFKDRYNQVFEQDPGLLIEFENLNERYGKPAVYTPKTNEELRSLCKNVKVNLWEIDTSQVTDFSEVFSGIERESFEGLDEWDTSKATDLSKMFYGLYDVELPSLAAWNVSKVTDFSGMFREFVGKINFNDFSEWDVNNKANFDFMICNSNLRGSEFEQFFDKWKVPLPRDHVEVTFGKKFNKLDDDLKTILDMVINHKTPDYLPLIQLKYTGFKIGDFVLDTHNNEDYRFSKTNSFIYNDELNTFYIESEIYFNKKQGNKESEVCISKQMNVSELFKTVSDYTDLKDQVNELRRNLFLDGLKEAMKVCKDDIPLSAYNHCVQIYNNFVDINGLKHDLNYENYIFDDILNTDHYGLKNSDSVPKSVENDVNLSTQVQCPVIRVNWNLDEVDIIDDLDLLADRGMPDDLIDEKYTCQQWSEFSIKDKVNHIREVLRKDPEFYQSSMGLDKYIELPASFNEKGELTENKVKSFLKDHYGYWPEGFEEVKVNKKFEEQSRSR